MQALRGLAWLLVLQSLGELMARGLGLPLPGPVIGMILLLVALRWARVREPVSGCADFLLSHLSLLFVPVGVGVMTHLSLVSQYWAAHGGGCDCVHPGWFGSDCYKPAPAAGSYPYR